MATAWLLTVHRTRSARPRGVSGLTRRIASGQLGAAIRGAWRDARRNPAEWVLLVLVPLVFILTAAEVTPDEPITIMVDEHGRTIADTLRMPDIHGATMAPIAIASLAAVLGLFALLDSRDGDRRATLAGLRWGILFTARMGILAALTALAALVSLATTGLVFDATRWPTYVAANLLIGFTYALIGALLAPIVGRVGGVFLAFLLPFLDIGVVQSPMLHPTPTGLAKLLPGYGGSRILLDGALTEGFDETRPLVAAFAWLLGLLVLTGLTYRSAVANRVSVSNAAAKAPGALGRVGLLGRQRLPDSRRHSG